MNETDETDETDYQDDRERFEIMQRLFAEGCREQDEQAHSARMSDPEATLQSVDEYLTQRCDLAYLAYWKKHSAYHVPCFVQSPEVDAWNEVCRARDLIRRPLSVLQQARLKPVRTKIHHKYFSGERGGN